MRTVLIADDDDGIRTLVRLTLGTDHSVIQAATGQEALDLAREHLPDIALLDLAMPELSGVQVCKALKADERTQGVRVVMLTARDNPADRSAARAAGADEYFTKPFSPIQLLTKIEELLRSTGLAVVTAMTCLAAALGSLS